MSDLISRQAAIDAADKIIERDASGSNAVVNVMIAWSEYIRTLSSVEPEKCGDIGEISDGYHTFNQLYHQRAILFAAIVNQNKGISWKSYKHSDGKYCFDSDGEWFVVGIDTPKGSYTYHYSKEYWDYFECKELDCGKEWDGHTEDDVIRLLSLASVEPERKLGYWYLLDECANEGWYCDQCHKKVFKADFSNTMRKYKFCPNCGSRMEA